MARMGLGTIGEAGVIFKRKFRWTLSISSPCGSITGFTCKTAARPKLEIEEHEINFLNGVTWIPGKAKWQPISVSFYDVAGFNPDLQALFNWISTIYHFSDSVNLPMSEKEGWAATANLKLYDGCGNQLEGWLLSSVWPQSIDFGELDYATGDFCSIDLTLRYSDVTYQPYCNGPTPTTCCRGCSTTNNGLGGGTIVGSSPNGGGFSPGQSLQNNR